MFIEVDLGREELREGLWNLTPILLFPIQFSKEKYILDSSPEKLHKELEEELKLSSTDLRSHAWYHGRIPREVSWGPRQGSQPWTLPLMPWPTLVHHWTV